MSGGPSVVNAADRSGLRPPRVAGGMASWVENAAAVLNLDVLKVSVVEKLFGSLDRELLLPLLRFAV